MTLTEYLEKSGTRRTDFAKLVGLSNAQISRIITGASRPGLDAMQRIAEATNYEVLPNDWYGLAPVEPVPINTDPPAVE